MFLAFHFTTSLHRQCLQNLRLCLFALMLMLACNTASAQQADSISRWGMSLSAMKGEVVAADQYVKKWLKRGDNFSLALELMRAPLPKDSDDFAADYGNPTFAFGVRYTFNNKVSLHREADTDWGMLIPVGYHSKLWKTI